MLVLTRQIDEAIVIDGHIEVRVLRIQGGKVRLGIVAPDNVSVDRQEVLREKALSSQQSAFNDCLVLDAAG